MSAATAAPAVASGVELMEAIRDGRVDPPPAAVLFGLELLEVAEGRTVFGFRPDERFSNWQTTHGGVLAGVADFALTTAVITATPLGTDVVTTNLTVTYLRPLALDDGQARATGTVVHLGGTLAHAEVTLEDVQGRLLLRASGTCRIRAPR
ncbi:MAG TPA: PaaI family thioesterase [Acidimicrobiales bacterium]|nr:PaaI family thioesterase [Acidimicrobiales bacterium]